MTQLESECPVKNDLPLRDIQDLVFQVNPAFELIEHGNLPPPQKKVLGVLAEDPDQFGLLVSKELPALGVLAIDRASASLFESLQKPGRLPSENRDPGEIARLVLDGILEVEWMGQYVTGPSASDCLFTKKFEEPFPSDSLSALSYAALRCIQDTPLEDPKAIASWLYGYNCIPMSPSWARRFAGPEQIKNLLGLQPGGSVETILNDANYIHHQVPGWHTWQSLSDEWESGDDSPTYKLYVSPQPKVLAETLPVVASCFVQTNVPTFKLGIDGFGLLRPDRLIAYFSEYPALEETSRVLQQALSVCPAHGVPFTAALTADGLLSWGIDPPRSGQIPGWRGIESWRVWVTNLLARAVLRAKSLGDRAMEPWHYALLRLHLEGVQIDTWLPSVSMWKEEEVP